MDRNERAAFLALNTIFGFEPAAGHRLLEALGSARAAFTAGREALREALGPVPILGQIGSQALDKAYDSLERLEKDGNSFIPYGEEGYPTLLMECPDAPLGLYLRSASPATEIFDEGTPKVAVVGTRDISHYGSEWCGRIVEALSGCERKPLIVSGLALGTDITAQRTALENGLPTVGVMATGVDAVYPPQHEWAASQIASAPGSGLVTDYPMGTSPKAVNFVRRNRIIAGICSALILIESRVRGGGMISARLAASYDREVYALPGRVDDRRSSGCNLLIRERSAEPITDIDSLIGQLGFSPGGPSPRSASLEDSIRRVFASSPDVPRLAEAARRIKERRGIAVDSLAYDMSISYAEASSLVRMLESEGFIITDLFGNCRMKTNFS